MDSPTGNLEQELGVILNRYSAERGSNTPDFILAKYLTGCLEAFNAAVCCRDGWYGARLWHGMSETVRANVCVGRECCHFGTPHMTCDVALKALSVEPAKEESK